MSRDPADPALKAVRAVKVKMKRTRLPNTSENGAQIRGPIID